GKRQVVHRSLQGTNDHQTAKAAGGFLTARQAPHRPGTAPALGLRAGRAAPILEQTTTEKEMPMWFRSVFDPRKTRSSGAAPRRTPRWLRASRLLLEALEDRTLPSFFAPVSYAAGTNPEAVATGDFNGDGRPDLAVANYVTDNVSVLLGNPDGTFQPALNSAT